MSSQIVDSETVSERVSVAVVTAVADVLDRDPETIEPLSDAVDPEALDALFVPARSNSRPVGGEVTFSLEGCDVTVHANGRVEVVAHGRAEGSYPSGGDGSVSAFGEAGSRRSRVRSSTPSPGVRRRPAERCIGLATLLDGAVLPLLDGRAPLGDSVTSGE